MEKPRLVIEEERLKDQLVNLKHVGLSDTKGLQVLPFPYPSKAPAQSQEGRKDQGGVVLCARQVKEI